MRSDATESPTSSMQGDGELLISDADRDQISAVLGEHMAEGRLTVDELNQRLGVLYESRTRAQAAAVQARRRAITGDLEAANAAGRRDDVERLNAELADAKQTAASARQAVAKGDRAEAQRLLQRLRKPR